MKFLAQLQHMAASEILNIVPHDVYTEIKRRDPNPLFQAYVVGHEGEAVGKMVGMGTKVLNWFSSAINKLWENLQYGTKVFHGHNIDSSHEGRQSIGEVVGKTVKTIKDKVNAIAITYIYPDFKGLPLDVASIEADVNINLDDSVHDVDVGDITGIALGNSAIEKPGFAGATLLSQIQAFVNNQSQFNQGGRDMEITINDVKDFIKSKKIQPNDLFGTEMLTDDPLVKSFVETTQKELKAKLQGEYDARKRVQGDIDKGRSDMETQIKEKDEEIKKLKTEGAKVKATDLFGTKIKERKLDDKQAKFVKSKQAGFSPEDPESLDKEVDKFMDEKLEEYKETAKIFGQKVETKEGEPTGGGEPGSEEEGDASHIPD